MTDTTNTNTNTTTNTKGKTKLPETLCWTCKFCTGCTRPNPRAAGATAAATTGNNNKKEPQFFTCPWAHDHHPVPGWTAIRTGLKVTPTQLTTSYIVEKCPYYEPDLEAKIMAMDASEIALRLEISTGFVKEHLKLSRQVLYVYTKRYNKLARQHAARTGEDKPPLADRYKLKREIINDMLEATKDELDDILNASEDGTIAITDSSDDRRYNRELEQTERDCVELLRTLGWHYKSKKKKESEGVAGASK